MDTEAPVVDEAAEAVEDAADEAEADAGTEG